MQAQPSHLIPSWHNLSDNTFRRLGSWLWHYGFALVGLLLLLFGLGAKGVWQPQTLLRFAAANGLLVGGYLPLILEERYILGVGLTLVALLAAVLTLRLPHIGLRFGLGFAVVLYAVGHFPYQKVNDIRGTYTDVQPELLALQQTGHLRPGTPFVMPEPHVHMGYVLALQLPAQFWGVLAWQQVPPGNPTPPPDTALWRQQLAQHRIPWVVSWKQPLGWISFLQPVDTTGPLHLYRTPWGRQP
jgi:hypothetical protein